MLEVNFGNDHLKNISEFCFRFKWVYLNKLASTPEKRKKKDFPKLFEGTEGD